jgi:hypothetical protein
MPYLINDKSKTLSLEFEPFLCYYRRLQRLIRRPFYMKPITNLYIILTEVTLTSVNTVVLNQLLMKLNSINPGLIE